MRTFILPLLLAVLGMFAQIGRAVPIITAVVETGGDNEATDTIAAKWTGTTFPVSVANEPVPGAAIGNTYSVGVFGNFAPAFVDRNHRYTAAEPAAIPTYLLGGEYIMSGNDNRDNAGYRLDVTVAQGVVVYMLIDNRLGDADGATPPTFDATHMQWILDGGWTAVRTGSNRAADNTRPDEIGIDEGADGTINQYYSIYSKSFPAGTVTLLQADNAGQNMYGVVIRQGARPQLAVGLNFGADEYPNSPNAGSLAAGAVAGAVPQANWNNLTLANGSAAAMVADAAGSAVPTTITVEWTSPNTWSSTGRGEENNGFAAGTADHALMTGYIDTGNGPANVATVTVSGIPAEFTSGGYDVLVYGLGGVAGRGGAYTIGGETKYGTSPANPSAHVEDPGLSVTDQGTYVRFRGQYGSSFTLVASADAALDPNLVNFRAPVNAIQIVRNSDPNSDVVRGYLTKRRYDNVVAGSILISDLLNHPKYINDQYDFTCLRTDFSANNADECDNCGLVVKGYFIPTASGPHIFYLSADDQAVLFLSTDDSPANKVEIAREPEWAGRRNYIADGVGDGGGGRGDPPINRSAPINLQAGVLYYIEGAVKEAGGGDNLDVAVQGPGDPEVVDGARPIFGDRIATKVDQTGSSLLITQNPPPTLQVPEGDTATFTVAADAVSPICGAVALYQWQRNGVDIPGANSPTYSFGPVLPDAHLSTYRAVVRLLGITRVSSESTLEVLGRECLRVVKATGSGALNSVSVGFSTFVSTDVTTTDTFNYTVRGSDGSDLTVNSVAIGGDGRSVILSTAPQTENLDYTVTVENILSIVGSAVCAAPDNSTTFRSWVTGPGGGVEFTLFTQVGGGTDINILANHPTFPNSPDEIRHINTFDTGADIMENYGGRVRGLFIPPVSGAWNLFVTADDGSRLFFNANGPDAAGKVLISEETPGCCTAFAGRRTGPFNLEAGKGYYLEGIYKEAGGGDYIRVAARLANDTTTPLAPMPAEWTGWPAAPVGIGGPLNIDQQPADQTAVENSIVTLSIGASNPNGLPIYYQWTRNGEDIVGANKPTYTFGPVTVAGDNNAQFAVKLALIGTTATSASATLTVVPDTTNPTLVSISGKTDLSSLVLLFSEFITPESAADTFNYTIAGAPSVTSATLGADGKTVTLKLESALTPATTYQATVSGVTDLAGLVMNTVTVPVTTFAIKRGFTLKELYLNIPGVAVTDLTGNPKYPSSPDIVRYGGLLELNTFDEFENYGARMSGYVIPPVSGAYNFFMSSDDGGAFYLSTDSSPANLTLVASEPVWNGRRDWLGTTRRNAAAPENRSSTLFPSGIELTAGQMYYFEALVKEGGGGDNLAVTWQLPGAPLPASGSPALSGVYMASLVDPTGAALSITQQPVDQTSIITPGQPTANVTFSVAVSASGPNAANVFYQWMRDGGSGWQVVPGANSASYSFVPTIADNGAKYRAEVFIPGAEAISTAATLTVAQVNTPPRFTALPGDQNVLEDAGPQSVQWATEITAHSTGILPANFNSLPPGSETAGSAAIAGGILHLTDAINSQQGSFVTPASPTPIDSLTVTFRALIGGGTCCGDRTADGWSLTIGDVIVPVTFPVAAEEGAAQNSGFAVNFDSWDNAGTDEAPAVDVKVGGTVIAFQSFDGVREGGRAPAGPLITDPATSAPMTYKTGTAFTDVRIQLDPDGTLDVYFKGVRVIDNVQTGVPLPLSNARLAFGARTGGANDNHWIDDLLVVGSLAGEVVVVYPPQENPEPGQTVHFNVSNDNSSLFSVQPAVSPTGVLTYTPAPNANGSALVTVVAQDDGGTLGGGVDSSAPVTFRINVAPVNDCPTANGQAITVDAGATANFQLSGSDVEGDALTYNLAQGPAHGSVVIQNQTGAATYTPTAGYSGPDSFTFTVNDGTCSSAAATVTVTVRGTANECPVAVAKVEPNIKLSAGQVGTIVIAGNNANACLNLDGTASTDPDGDSLTYVWVVVLSDGTTMPLAAGATATACLDVGSYTVRLLVDDGTCVNTADVSVEIITPSEAVDALIDMVNDSTIERKNKRPFIASLKAAGASFDRGSCESAHGQLGAFINKVRAQIARDNPDVAADLIRLANAILAQTECPEEEQP